MWIFVLQVAIGCKSLTFGEGELSLNAEFYTYHLYDLGQNTKSLKTSFISIYKMEIFNDNCLRECLVI